jgi:hypothetical protein
VAVEENGSGSQVEDKGSGGVGNRKLEQTFHGHVRHFPRQIEDLQVENEV